MLVYSVSFIFTPGKYDEEFYALDDAILAFAQSITGYLGKETWYSEDKCTKNAVYYWDSKEALREFSCYEAHLKAKTNYKRWYKGFQVVVSKVEASYGDGGIAHITANIS